MNAADRLYELLPAVYRERDAEEGYPLRALLGLVEGQADLLHADIQQLWDDFFIETCQRWVIPYIGDLVSNNLLHDAGRIAGPDTTRALFPDLLGRDLRPPIAIRTRADVAKTIYYRRRKGTVPMLEELARDVTGWPAHVVEFFELLGWTQWVRNHLRMHSLRTPDIRRVEPLDRLNGPFDAISHTVDVRPVEPLTGWYNIKKVGFFLWRIRSYPLTNVAARVGSLPWRYHFSPLGNPAPLFTRWRREGDEAGLATELHVAGPIRRALFYEDLATYRNQPPPRADFTELYGLFEPVSGGTLAVAPDASFFIFRNGVAAGDPVAPAQDPNADLNAFTPQIICRRLDPWPANQPSGAVIAVDVERGRIAVGDQWPDATTGLDVFYHSGFSADLGGGPYERGKWLVRPELAELRLLVQESGATPGSFTSLGAALAQWVAQGRPNTIISILDNRSYHEALSLELADDRWLVIESANGRRPHIRPTSGAIEVTGDHPGAEFTLSGLLVEGGVSVGGDLRRLRLLHSTLVPGRGLDEDGMPMTSEPSVAVDGVSGGQPINGTLRVEVAFSIVGPIRLPEHALGLWLLDSIVDGLGGTALAATNTTDQPGPPATLERVTVLGSSYAQRLLLASETLFTAPVVASRQQEGCVRFSFVPHESQTPRRYRCQPDLEIAARIAEAEKQAAANNLTLTAGEKAAIRDRVRRWLVPAFTSTKYGEPAYAQLHLHAPLMIRTGAEDGSEMGVFCHLKQPQREANLRLRLEEYLPFGLEPGVLYVT
jgi:hypothetical protein